MDLRTSYLWAKGGLYEATVPCVRARNEVDVTRAFEMAMARQQKLTLVGARKSFGEQFLPPPGQVALDVSRLDVGARIVEEEPNGALWVRAGGGTTFAELHARFPQHQPHCPPTSDNISVAGALAACTHNAIGYFADSVRAFTLLAPNGSGYRCSALAPGLEGELFRNVPGSFGLLGATTDIEVRLEPVVAGQQYVVNALHAGEPTGDTYLRQFERVVDTPRYRWGNGMLLYGNRRHYIVFGDEKLGPGQSRDARQALLTDDNLVQQALTQGVVNRFPRLAELAMSRTYHEGAGLPAPWYGFLFFQRSYDIAHDVLSGPGLGYRALRALGVDPKLTVCHQTWFFPRDEVDRFMDVYWDTMDRYPGVEKRAEQQDMVLLPPCRWPAHTLGETEDGVGALTCTFSVRRDAAARSRVSEFFGEVTARALESDPRFRVSLCKQMHGDPQLLRTMHADYVRRISELKRQVDPRGLLTSRFWQVLSPQASM